MEIKTTTKPKKIRKLLAILLAMGFMSFASVNVANAVPKEIELNNFIKSGEGDYTVTTDISLGTAVSERTRTKSDEITLVGQSAETYISGASGGGAQQGFYFGDASAETPPQTNVTIKTLTIKQMSATNGGAIMNREGGTLTIDNVTFDSNTSTIVAGGAIYNNKGTTNISNSTFKSNTSPLEGGAIFNSGNMSITGATFDGNKTQNGGANGGAIIHRGNTLTISGSTFTSNTATGNGGAIWNGSSGLEISGSTFTNNTATQGGAIWNGSSGLKISGSTFTSNTATDGGAIWNGSSGLKISGSTFTSNTATGQGGAIYNTQEMTLSGENTFKNNTATTDGGAIYNLGGANEGIINFSGTNTFIGNTVNSTPNDIYNDGGILNINDGTTTINGGISGSGTTNINGGTLQLNDGTISQDNIVVNDGGTLSFGANAITKTATTPLCNLQLAGGTLSLINGGIDTLYIMDMNLTKNSSIAIDADLASQTAPFDKINVDKLGNSSNYTINISNIKVLSDFANPDTVSKTYPIQDIITSSYAATQDIIKSSVECNLTNVVGYSPIYKYNFNYDKTTGMITASRFGGENYDVYNPAILPSPVSSQIAGYTTMVESFNQGFNFVDNFMGMTKAERMAYRDRNKYALLDHTPQYTGSASKSAWVMPYTSFENVKLNNGPDIDAITYGTYFGGDSELYSLKHGWEAVYSLFAGYNGAYQTFGGVNMNYNGGSLGAAATFFKGNFFTAIDVAVGGGVSTANTMFGIENATLLSAGGALKAGYNFEFKEGRHIIQPSLLVGYSFTNTFDYTNAAGIDITSDPLHAIILQPQIKYILNLKNGWQPYAAVSMVFNIMDKSKFYAQDIALPEMSMKPYVQYGLGVQKKWGERCTGYVQAMVRNGGRNGVALSLGFKWQLGKGSSL